MTKEQYQSQLADEACLVCFGISDLSDLLEISRLEMLADHTSPFDPTLCAETGVTAGGGNTFECYAAGTYTTLNTAGTGLGAAYVGDNPRGSFGETFEDYSVGAYAGGTPGASTTGLTTIFVG